MKKLIYCALALAAGLFAASCQQENLEPVAQENTVTYTVEVPGVDTKAIGDGQNVDQLVYEVWKTGEDGVITDKSTRLYQKTINLAPDAPRKWIVSLNLVQNQTYKALFWAQVGKPEGHENYNTDQLTNVYYAHDVTKDYSSNQESYAAFYGTDVLDTHTPLKGKTITLTRPFAQLNIGTLNTALEDEYAIDMLQSSVEVTVPTQFNVATSDVDNHQKISFALADVPSDPKVLPVSGTDYDYVAMNYVFAGANTSVEYTINTTITPSGATEGTPATINKTIPNVPLKENYRTNIVGNLLTSSAQYEVVIDKNFNTPDEIVEAWNGTEVKAPKQSPEDENIYVIEYPSELAWFAAAVNGTLPETKAAPAADSFAGKTFKLIDNVDLGNNEWTPIGNSTNPFKGTFDGNGKTVKNLKITGKNSNVGLFGMTTDGEIKNLTVENAIVSGRLNVGVVAGTPYTSKYTNITVQGHVEVNGMAYVGAVGGKDAYANWTDITVNVDETSYVNANSIENGTAYRSYVGGVVGFNGEGGHSFKNITSNIYVKGSTIDVGGLFGIAHYGNQFENCSCSGDVEIYAAEEADEAQEIGGIAGVWNNGGADVVMTNCEFTGTVTTNIDRETVWYSNLVGRPYSATGTGKLIIDGAVVVTSATELQAAVNAASGETKIKFGADIEGNVIVAQKQGVKITIDGCNKKYNGFIKVHSNSNHYADAALTIKYVNFEHNTLLYNAKGEPYFNFIEALENGAERYSTNITAENCTFTATGEAKNIAVGLQIKSSKWAKALNCITTGLHSLVQAQSCDETVVVNGCTINGKNGVAFKQVKAATVEGTTITAAEYGIRFDGNTDNYGITVKDINVTAVQPLIVRKMTGQNNTITLEGTNTLTTEAEYQIVITKDSDDQPYVKPTGTYTLTGAENFAVYEGKPVATVGNTEYDNINKAIEAWTHNTTLTLCADVTLSDVVTLKSTEHHILNLSTFTMTAASGKNAFEITPLGAGTAAKACLTINASSENPGGINAGSKACVYYKKTDGSNDRMMVTINGGVFDGTISSSSNNGGQACPYFVFNGGTFNKSINLSKAMLKVTGGIFHGMFSCTGDSTAHRLISGGTFKSWTFMTADAANKFCVGTDKQTYNVGVYVNDEGYLVVGGPVITEFGDKFAAKATNATKWSSYLQYSSAAANGLYYTNAEMAITKHGEANVVLP